MMFLPFEVLLLESGILVCERKIERNPAAPAVFNRDGKAILGTFTASQFGLQLR